MSVKAITATKANTNQGVPTHAIEDNKQRRKALLAQMEKQLDKMADDLHDEMTFDVGLNDAEAAREVAEMAQSIVNHYTMAANEASTH